MSSSKIDMTALTAALELVAPQLGLSEADKEQFLLISSGGQALRLDNQKWYEDIRTACEAVIASAETIEPGKYPTFPEPVEPAKVGDDYFARPEEAEA